MTNEVRSHSTSGNISNHLPETESLTQQFRRDDLESREKAATGINRPSSTFWQSISFLMWIHRDVYVTHWTNEAFKDNPVLMGNKEAVPPQSISLVIELSTTLLKKAFGFALNGKPTRGVTECFISSVHEDLSIRSTWRMETKGFEAV